MPTKSPPTRSTRIRLLTKLTYKTIVTLQGQAIEREGKTYALSPGMQVAAEINQGRRTVLEYLLSPVQGVFQEAGRKR